MRILILSLILLFGCTAPLLPTPSTPNASICANLDNTHRAWGAIAKFTGVLAGAGGLATLPIDQDQKTFRLSVGVGALLMGGLSAASVYIEQDAATSYTTQCVNKLEIKTVGSGL